MDPYSLPVEDDQFSADQRRLLDLPFDAHVFLEGPAGAGKTSAAVGRLLRMLSEGIPGDSILVLTPQRTLALAYERALRLPETAAGGQVTLLTFGGLAQRMVSLFWPLVAEKAGFAQPDRPPTFFTLETAQYSMAHLIRPRLDEERLFDSVTLDRNRLYSQVIDNLNKAAVVGFPSAEIGERLKSAWIGEPGQLHVYDDVQSCADDFRRFCLEHNLLDFSLQVEVFREIVWPLPECRAYLQSAYRHLICDNLEEDTPVAHDLLVEWVRTESVRRTEFVRRTDSVRQTDSARPHFDSALLVFDWEGGYRRFLGADPGSAYQLKTLCTEQIVFPASLVQTEGLHGLETQLASALARPTGSSSRHFFFTDRSDSALESPSPGSGPELESRSPAGGDQHPAPLHINFARFYPEMLDWVAQTIAGLVQEGLPPGEIVVLAPYLSDALRFSLTERLAALEIPARSHRPSRSLREEPATECLLALAAIAHPDWDVRPTRFDAAYTLMQAIDELDLVRAQLLAEIVYRLKSDGPWLTSFDNIRPEMQARITYRLGARYEKLRLWLEAARQEPAELDHFLSRLFGEVLSQPGFGFHASYDSGQVAANLIESVQKFRWVAGPVLAEQGVPLGKEYLLMVQDGVIAAQYLGGWRLQAEDAVLLAPAYTFLMANRPVEVQFWLDVGSRGWAERLYQPLTHPYVLTRAWPSGQPWSDADEYATGSETLRRLALGLLRRCRRAVYLGLSELNEQGYEQRGPLLAAFQRLLRQGRVAAAGQ